MNKNELLKLKKIAVFGMGKSGISSVKALLKLKLPVYAVNIGKVNTWDAFPELSQILEPQFLCPEDEAEDLFSQMDLVVLSPGIPTNHPVLRRTNKIISEIELGYILSSEIPVIAITGTNGKTTTTTMVSESLKMAGKNVFCGGNIGLPYTELFIEGNKADWAVIEVSSFQLETIETFHPQIAMVLNVSQNHTERYERVVDYAKAKFNIFKNMTANDCAIVGENALFIKDWIKNIKTIFFNSKNLNFSFDFSKTKLMGEHNRANFYCAYEVLRILNIPNKEKLFQEFIDTFKGVAHRLEFVRTWNDLSIFNDAKSTNIEATKTALNAFSENTNPLYLILGGKLRNETDTFLQDLLPYKNKVTEIFVIGDTAHRLENELKNDFKITNIQTLENLMNLLKIKKPKGNLVFSPAHPSFDQFKNYVHRGESFKALISSLS